MKKLLVAFDVDGTLRNNQEDKTDKETEPLANERIRQLLIILSSFHNVEIMVWSGVGELYARQMARTLHVDKYVDSYASKNFIKKIGKKPIFEPDIVPDIAIDDIWDCELGKMNLIVKEK